MVSSSRVGRPGLPSDAVEYAGGRVKSTAPVPKPGQPRRCFDPTAFELCSRI